MSTRLMFGPGTRAEARRVAPLTDPEDPCDLAGADGGRRRVRLGEVLVQWGRIGCIGFGGPPTHIALLRDLCVDRTRWIGPTEFQDAIAA